MIKLRELVDDGTFTYDAFVQFAFDNKTSNFSTWKIEDWLCVSCIRSIITEYLHLWMLEAITKGL